MDYESNKINDSIYISFLHLLSFTFKKYYLHKSTHIQMF